MKTFYILGTNKLDKLPTPKDFDLFKIEATNLDDAIKLASKQSDKRYFCSVNLTVLNKDGLPTILLDVNGSRFDY